MLGITFLVWANILRTGTEDLSGTVLAVSGVGVSVRAWVCSSFPSASIRGRGFWCLIFRCDLDTLTYQNLLFCRVPINSILGLIIRSHKKVGFGRLR